MYFHEDRRIGGFHGGFGRPGFGFGRPFGYGFGGFALPFVVGTALGATIANPYPYAYPPPYPYPYYY